MRHAFGWGGIAAASLTMFQVGCQTYEPQPLDLDDYGTRLEVRATTLDRLQPFIDRMSTLSAGGDALPENFAYDDGLTSAEGEVVALFFNRELHRARLRAGVAAAEAEFAGLWSDPEFEFSGAEILSPSGPFEFGAGIRITIPVSGRLKIEKAKATLEHAAALDRIVAAEWNLRADVRRAWAEWTVAGERLAVLRESIQQIERVNVLAMSLEAAGELSRVEARLMQVEMAERRAMIVAAELEATRARVRLLGLMGLAPDASIELVPSLLVPALSGDTERDAHRLIHHNPDIAACRSEYAAAEESLRLEVRKQYPDITIGGGYGSEGRDDRLLLGFSVPIPILSRNKAGIAAGAAQRDVVRADAEATFEELLGALAIARAERVTARQLRQELEDTIVPMLDTQAAEIEAIAELGEVDSLLLLTTIQRQYAATSQLLDLRLAHVNASIEVARLLGPRKLLAPAPVGAQEPGSSSTPPDGGAS